MHPGLQDFHPLIQKWFEEEVGAPTDVQSAAWPAIAQGRHVLVTAPTGSGKTLTAFLWAIHQLATQSWTAGAVRVLYVSPLKALNNDIRRNLIRPLAALRDVFRKAGEPFPEIRVLTRSGDTPQADRRRMLRKPPEILITTPESLNLLLSSQGGRSVLTGIRTVILDEIHAVVNTKRGTHLITAVDRLVPLSGEFQRIALSATVRPAGTVAQFVGGYRLSGPPEAPEFHPREVAVIQSRIQKAYAIRVSFPDESGGEPSDDFWDPLIREFRSIILRNQSTLFFVNSRRLAESLTLRINAGEAQPVAYAHHGSLSREIRLDVEQRLKSGRLRAIVATHSLELGIDIGHLDEVVLVQSPGSISSAIQRIGRAGHRVGEVSRGTIYPTHDQDFIEAAALTPEIPGQNIESVRPVRRPLDVLAQVLVSMIGVEAWPVEALYNQIRTSGPYRELGRENFDRVMNMLAGRYAGSRIRELSPRIALDRTTGTAQARKGALLAVYTGGGVIPDRGYFHLRHQQSGAVIGELDEEFVWEARIGQSFTLGTQHWRIERITHNDVFVLPGDSKTLSAPFWKGEELNRDFHFSTRLSGFLEEADAGLSEAPGFESQLQERHHMDPAAADRLLRYLRSQKDHCGCPLPHRHHVLIEKTEAGPGGVPGNQAVIHTFWGGSVNRPFALALDAAWEERFGQRLEIFAGNDAIILHLPHDIGADELLALVPSAKIEPLLRKRLEGSGYFGARFRECAGTALLLKRSRFRERMPLWMSRLHSQKLLETVMGYPDFPILLEAWRTCLQDHFDLDSLRLVLDELKTGVIRVSEVRTSLPSPMARNPAWRQINQYMYESDGLASGRTSRLRGDLIREVAYSPQLRPAIPSDLIRRFEEKLQRLSAGYAPSDFLELAEWVRERVLIPEPEWESLHRAVRRDRPDEADGFIGEAEPRLARIRRPGVGSALILLREEAARIQWAIYPEESSSNFESMDGVPLSFIPQYDQSDDVDTDETASRLISEWMRFYGPKSPDWIGATLGIPRERLAFLLEDLADSERVIRGPLIQDSDAETVCDAGNFEILLRMRRAESVPRFSPLPAERLPVFLAHFQGLGEPDADVPHLTQCLEQIVCHPASAPLWASEILPARVARLQPAWIDRALQASGLLWIGQPGEQILFAFETDLELIREEGPDGDETLSPDGPDGLDILFPDASARYPFPGLLARSGLQPRELIGALWRAVWEGRVSNDTYDALHRGVETGFTVPEIAVPAGHSNFRNAGGRRARFGVWRRATTCPGNWFRLPRPVPAADPVEAEERRKDRARILLDRYGILFRELLLREPALFQWRTLFRTLRIMELSGEILSGYFFEGVPGPQFISHHAYRMLRRLPENRIFWMNALDPASLCGVPIDALKAMLPRRHESTHLVFRGKEIVLISQKRGAELEIHPDADDPALPECLGVLGHLLMRPLKPLRRISIQTINGEEAPKSRYVGALRICFDVSVEPKAVILYRKRE
ncbi:MAG TPA: DEAD/DEAH box helicase [bacterium]|nr:DEAD/DEAH box helicase [bacterium]